MSEIKLPYSAEEIAHLLDEFNGYKSGDSYIQTSANDMFYVSYAYVTGAASQLTLNIDVPKSIENISSITCTKFIASFRIPNGGYVFGGPVDYVQKSSSMSVTKVNKNKVCIMFHFASKLSVTNNIPIIGHLEELELHFN